MNRTPRIAATLIAIVTMLVVLPDDARACSCVATSPHEQLARADAAFVGELVSRPDHGSPGKHGDIEGDYVFIVEHVVKGQIPERITVRSPLGGSACGFEASTGRRVGVALRRVDGHWSAGLCDQVDPDALLAAAGPPPPAEAGEIAALVGMKTEGGRSVALDAKGALLTRGAGQGELAAFALCPGAETIIEHSWVRGEDGAAVASILSARDLTGFQVLHEVAGPQVPSLVSDIACMDQAGSEVLLLAPGQILRVTGTEVVEVARLEAQSGCPGGGRFDPDASMVYFIGGAGCRALYRHDLERGGVAAIARIPDDAGIDALVSMALSPDGRHLVIEAHPGPEPLTFRVLMFDLAADPVTSTEGVFAGPFEPHTFLWLANDRFLLTGTTDSLDEAFILSPQLEQIGTVTGIHGGSGGIQGDRMYVLEPYGRLVTAPVEGGTANLVRSFDDPTIRALLVLPAPVRFDPAVTGTETIVDMPLPSTMGTTASTGGPDGSTVGRIAAGCIILLLASTAMLLILKSRRREEVAR